MLKRIIISIRLLNALYSSVDELALILISAIKQEAIRNCLKQLGSLRHRNVAPIRFPFRWSEPNLDIWLAYLLICLKGFNLRLMQDLVQNVYCIEDKDVGRYQGNLAWKSWTLVDDGQTYMVRGIWTWSPASWARQGSDDNINEDYFI